MYETPAVAIGRLQELDRQLLDVVAERASLACATAAARPPAGAYPARVQEAADGFMAAHSRLFAALDHAAALGISEGDAAVVITAVEALCRNAVRRSA